MQDHDIQRLRHGITKIKDHYGSWKRFADELEKFSNGKAKIDRRTLERICGKNWKSVQLKIEQLLLLDRFFVLHNEEPLLMKDLTIVDTICESPEACFLLASKYQENRRDYTVAAKDLQSFINLSQTRISRQRMQIFAVTDAEDPAELQKKLKWGAAIVLASPVANFASEITFCSMIGRELGVDCMADVLPFFIVGADFDVFGNSLFVRSPEEAQIVVPDVEEQMTPECRALVVDGKLFASTEDATFALLVCQRCPETGHVRVVLCGLTGTGTERLSTIIAEGHPKKTLPPLTEGQTHPPIQVTVYKMHTKTEWDARGREQKRVIRHTVEYGPKLVHYHESRWQFL